MIPVAERRELEKQYHCPHLDILVLAELIRHSYLLSIAILIIQRMVKTMLTETKKRYARDIYIYTYNCKIYGRIKPRRNNRSVH